MSVRGMLRILIIVVWAVVPMPRGVAGHGHIHSFTEMTAHLEAGARDALMSEGVVSNFLDTPALPLLPPSVGARTRELLGGAGEKPFIVERMRFIPLSREHARETSEVFLYNLTRSINGMESAEYVSPFSGIVYPLYLASYAIDTPEGRNQVADPLVTAAPPPEADTIYISQKVYSLGTNVYRTEYMYDGGVVSVDINNIHTIWYTIFPVVKKEQLRIFSAVILTDAGVLVYTGFVLREARLGKKIQERGSLGILGLITGTHDWFADNIYAHHGITVGADF